MPNTDVLKFLRSGLYPSARAAAPGNGLDLLRNALGTPTGGVYSSKPAASLLPPGVEMPGFNQNGGIGNTPYGPANPNNKGINEYPFASKKKGGGLGGMLAALLGSQGGGSNPVVDEITRQMGMLQNQAGKSKSDILTHEANARKDLLALYGHLNQYIANQRGQNNADFKNNLRQSTRDFNLGRGNIASNYKQAEQQAAAEDKRMGLSGDIGQGQMAADSQHQQQRLAGDRADLRADMRSQRGDWNALSRQMQADSKLEGNVQIGQVHRDTTKALSDLANTLQSQLGQLRMARAQAAASGQGNPLDLLSKELDLKKKMIDIKAAQKKLAGGTPSSGSASKGFEAAMNYLGQQGPMGPAMQSLLSSARAQLSVPSNAGGGTDLSKYTVKGANGQQMPDYWANNNISGLLQWMQNKIATPGGNSGMGPGTPQEMNQLLKALLMATGQ